MSFPFSVADADELGMNRMGSDANFDRFLLFESSYKRQLFLVFYPG